MTDFERLLAVLASAGVRFVVVGGVAAAAHGAIRTTRDLDLVYDRDPENLERLASALAPHAPYLRGAPPGLPFRLDRATLAAGLNFTLTTELGELDLLGEIAGGGGFGSLVAHSVEIRLGNVRFRCLDLERLIETKRAAGRPKDFEALAELEAILEDRRPS